MRVIVTTVTITAAGTRVQVSNTRDDVKVIHAHARAGNAGNTYWGTSDVSSANGEEMLPDGKHKEDFGDGSVLLSTFYVDAAVSGDKVDVVAIVNP